MAVDPVTVGEGVIIITRRSFPEDERRHFIGRVTASTGSLIRVEGHAWIANSIGNYEQRHDLRTRLFSLATGGEVVLVVPPEIDVDGLRYASAGGRLIITDGSAYTLDISEFGRVR
jgi:hypothetical protein